MPHADADAALPCGWLTKQGGFRASWRRRWFSFDEAGDNLNYFEAADLDNAAKREQKRLEPRGAIALASVLRVRPTVEATSGGTAAPQSTLSLYEFEIYTPRRRYLIRADTAAEQARWVSALRAASAHVRTERQRELDVLRSLSLAVRGARKASAVTAVTQPLDTSPSSSSEYDFTLYQVQASPLAGSSGLCGGQPWVVYKRYSEFRALAAALQSVGEITPSVPLPPTKWFANTDPEVVRDRVTGLQSWLHGVVAAFEHPLVVGSNPATQDSTKDAVNQHPDTVSQAAWLGRVIPASEDGATAAGSTASTTSDVQEPAWSMIAAENDNAVRLNHFLPDC